MARKERLALIQKIEKKRSSKVIAYLTGDRPGLQMFIDGQAIPILERHVRAVSGRRTKKLDLLIYSRGGDANVPWSLISMMREFLGERPLGILIPFRAHSAATVIALGADEIVMTKMGELGPIDPTIGSGPHNPRDPNTGSPLPISVEEARGFMELSDTFGLEGSAIKTEAFKRLIAEVHPLALGAVNRLLSQTENVAEQLLARRKNPLPEDTRKSIVKKFSTEIGSHAHVIRRTEAVEIGLDNVTAAADIDLEKELWQLFQEYSDFLDLTSPFLGQDELISKDSDLENWQNLPIGIIESTSLKHVFRQDARIRRLRDVPPNITIDVSNLQLTTPNIPAGLNAQSLQNYVKNIIGPVVQAQVDAAIKQAVKSVVKAMPEKGFQSIFYNGSWRRDGSQE